MIGYIVVMMMMMIPWGWCRQSSLLSMGIPELNSFALPQNGDYMESCPHQYCYLFSRISITVAIFEDVSELPSRHFQAALHGRALQQGDQYKVGMVLEELKRS